MHHGLWSTWQELSICSDHAGIRFSHTCLRKLYVLSSRGLQDQGPDTCLLEVMPLCSWSICAASYLVAASHLVAASADVSCCSSGQSNSCLVKVMPLCSWPICAATSGGLHYSCQKGVDFSVLFSALGQSVLHHKQLMHPLMCHALPAPLDSQICKLQGFFYKEA